MACLASGGLLLGPAAFGRGQQDTGVVPESRVARIQPADPITGVATRSMGPVDPTAARRSGPAPRGGAAPRAGTAARSVTTPQSAVATQASQPVRMTLRRLGIDALVLPVTVGADGLLAVPANPRQLGWWAQSARPGMPSGSVVIDGHVDSATRGLGALFRLSEAAPGDDVVVTNSAGATTNYTVAARRSYAKTSLPVAEVFARDVGPRLVLVTCGGRFDPTTRHYADNVVIYAVPR